MLAYLATLGIPTMVVVTKIDKLAPTTRSSRVEALRRGLDLAPEQVIGFSASTGEGRDTLADAIVSLVAANS